MAKQRKASRFDPKLLVEIIDKIESERIKKISALQELKVGRKVSYMGRQGQVTEVSPKFTSVIVEFHDKTRLRFFLNKRKNKKTIDELTFKSLLDNVYNKSTTTQRTRRS